MIEREKIQLLAQINRAMLDAALKVEDALKKRDSNAVLQLKSYLLEAQKKFESYLQG